MLDPFAGSGTTLVQCLESGYDAVGVDIAAFNCLLMRVKTSEYDPFRLESDVRGALARRGRSPGRPTGFVGQWFAPDAAAELLHFRSLLEDYEHADVLRVVLARAARSARLTTHFDLDFPRDAAARALLVPQAPPHLHARSGGGQVPPPLPRRHARPAEDLPARACSGARAEIVHGDATEVALDGSFDAILTSPPYPGLIDYHEQHRYAYEILGLDDRRERELGAAAAGTSRRAIESYVAGISTVLRRGSERLADGAPVLVVVNDRRNLYPEILERSGLRLVDRLERHVNRRTGRRAGEYFESILVCVRET